VLFRRPKAETTQGPVELRKVRPAILLQSPGRALAPPPPPGAASGIPFPRQLPPPDAQPVPFRRSDPRPTPSFSFP